MILTKKNVALLPAQKERKKKNRQNQKRNQNKPARPLNKERKKISPRFTAFAAGHAFNNQIREKPISFKIDFEILQNDHPPSCPPPYTDNEK